MHARARSLLPLLALVLLTAAVWFVTRTPDVAPAAAPPAPPPSAEGPQPASVPTALAPAPRSHAAETADPPPGADATGRGIEVTGPASPTNLEVRVQVPAGHLPTAVRVRVIDARGRAHGGLPVEALSPTEGSARYAGLTAGWARVFAEAEDLVRAEPTDVDLEPGAELTVRCELTAGVRMEGRVVAVGTGAPIAGAVVQAEWGGEAFGFEPSPYGRVTTDAGGAFRTVTLPPDAEVLLVAWAKGYGRGSEGPMAVAQAGRARTIRLEPAGALRGSVVDPHGDPISHAHVAVEIVSTGDDPPPSPSADRRPQRRFVCDTDREGRFELFDLPLDTALTCVAYEDERACFAPSAVRPPFRLTAAAPDMEISFSLRAGAASRVTILDTLGQPIAGSHVTIGSGGFERTAESGVDGTARLEGIAPGHALLRVLRNGYVPVEEVIALVEGQTTDRQFALHRGLHLAGTVVDGAGAPTPGALVSLRRMDGRPCSAGPQAAGSRGEFRFEGLEPGAHRIRVQEEHDRSTLPELSEQVVDQVSVDDLRVVRKPLAAVRASFKDTQGHPVEGPIGVHATNIEEVSTSTSSVGSDGTVTWFLLPGSWSLRLRAKDCLPWQRIVEVPPGASIDLGDILLEASATIEGVVVDLDGSPVKGARLAATQGGLEAFADTDSEGRFRLAGLPLREVRVNVFTGTFAQRDLDIDPRRATPPLRVILERGSLLDATLRIPPGDAWPEWVRYDLIALNPGPGAFPGISAKLSPKDAFRWRAPGGRYALKLLLDDRVVWQTELALEEGKDVTVEIPLPAR